MLHLVVVAASSSWNRQEQPRFETCATYTRDGNTFSFTPYQVGPRFASPLKTLMMMSVVDYTVCVFRFPLPRRGGAFRGSVQPEPWRGDPTSELCVCVCAHTVAAARSKMRLNRLFFPSSFLLGDTSHVAPTPRRRIVCGFFAKCNRVGEMALSHRPICSHNTAYRRCRTRLLAFGAAAKSAAAPLPPTTEKVGLRFIHDDDLLLDVWKGYKGTTAGSSSVRFGDVAWWSGGGRCCRRCCKHFIYF